MLEQPDDGLKTQTPERRKSVKSENLTAGSCQDSGESSGAGGSKEVLFRSKSLEEQREDSQEDWKSLSLPKNLEEISLKNTNNLQQCRSFTVELEVQEKICNMAQVYAQKLEGPRKKGRPKKIKINVFSLTKKSQDSNVKGENEEDDERPNGKVINGLNKSLALDETLQESLVEKFEPAVQSSPLVATPPVLEEKEEVLPKPDNNDIMEEEEEEAPKEVEFKAGDLVWARIGNHPYWPCMVVPEPGTNVIKKNTNKLFSFLWYHVRFFMDKGRRAWVRHKNMLPFKSKEDLIGVKNTKKEKKVYIINPTVKITASILKWLNAIDEADSCVDLILQKRLVFFDKVIEMDRAAKNRRKSIAQIEDLFEDEEDEEDTKKRESNEKEKTPKKRKLKEEKTPKSSPKPKKERKEKSPTLTVKKKLFSEVKEKKPKPAKEDKKKERKSTPKTKEETPAKKEKKARSPKKENPSNKSPKVKKEQTKTPKKEQTKTPKKEQTKTPKKEKTKTPKKEQTKTPKKEKSKTPKKDKEPKEISPIISQESNEELKVPSPFKPPFVRVDKDKIKTPKKDRKSLEANKQNKELEAKKNLQIKRNMELLEDLELIKNLELQQELQQQSSSLKDKNIKTKKDVTLQSPFKTPFVMDKETSKTPKKARKSLEKPQEVKRKIAIVSPSIKQPVNVNNGAKTETTGDLIKLKSDQEPGKIINEKSVEENAEQVKIGELDLESNFIQEQILLKNLPKKSPETSEEKSRSHVEKIVIIVEQDEEPFKSKTESDEEFLIQKPSSSKKRRTKSPESDDYEFFYSDDSDYTPPETRLKTIAKQPLLPTPSTRKRPASPIKTNRRKKAKLQPKLVDIIPTIETLTELHERNNVFKGVLKKKACSICKQQKKNVLRCKGKCNGYYHAECAKAQSFNRIKVEVMQANSKFDDLSLSDKIDLKMKELMGKITEVTIYPDPLSDEEEEIEVVFDNFEDLVPLKSVKEEILETEDEKKLKEKNTKIIKHVTADCSDDGSWVEDDRKDDFKCGLCLVNEDPYCSVCLHETTKNEVSTRVKCTATGCNKYYHLDCLRLWPQTQWNVFKNKTQGDSDGFICPMHVCHTCVSDNPRQSTSRCTGDKVVRCLRCPATYHATCFCMPAGSLILSTTQIVCPRHYAEGRFSQMKKKLKKTTINTAWCFICGEGGNLVCCDTCPTSVHAECLPIHLTEDNSFICEDCESGRFPLYGEIVWAKLGKYRWWPAEILFPDDIPARVEKMPHTTGEFVVRFFGTYNHYWIGRNRTFLYQDGDTGYTQSSKKKTEETFIMALEEAAAAHHVKKQFKAMKMAEINRSLKPPHYIRIKTNRPVGNVKMYDFNISSITACDCSPFDDFPCGSGSNCLNRLLLTECNPEVCPAGNKCNNQRFQKRSYPPLMPYKTAGRGWGLKSSDPIREGQFVIEYVGEVVDETEYQRRMKVMHQKREENYYFLTIDTTRIIDAGPKGNLARFMNHSCEPNCETQKWTVNGNTRVGLFARTDIPAHEELTFNYNLECTGTGKKICTCGANKCSGYIGVKVKNALEVEAKVKKVASSSRSSTSKVEIKRIASQEPCIVCMETDSTTLGCSNKMCSKYYHVKCLDPKALNKTVCPSHNCNICDKRTIRCCIQCVNSYCPQHSEGMIRHDHLLGFICKEHDTIGDNQSDSKLLRKKARTKQTKLDQNKRKTL